MLVLKECIVLSDQASFPPIICFQNNFPARIEAGKKKDKTKLPSSIVSVLQGEALPLIM
ncbi:hypothetical protein PHAVU_010G117266 [Phaseolus vulgaris]